MSDTVAGLILIACGLTLIVFGRGINAFFDRLFGGSSAEGGFVWRLLSVGSGDSTADRWVKTGSVLFVGVGFVAAGSLAVLDMWNPT